MRVTTRASQGVTTSEPVGRGWVCNPGFPAVDDTAYAGCERRSIGGASTDDLL
jgi:hypothetical protein